MSCRSRSSQAIEQRKQRNRQARKQLRQRQKAAGLESVSAPAMPNRKSDYTTVRQEQAARQDSTIEQHRVIKQLLPSLLDRLSKIADPRNPKKIKHRLDVLIFMGIMMFVYQVGSRREANRTMSLPMFMENLQMLFPALDTYPHQDTLNRLLSDIDVGQLELLHFELVQKLIRRKKFVRYLIDNGYPIAIDGTQKLVRSELVSEQWLERKINKSEGEQKQYYVYVLEANLAFHNGMVLPLASEFLDYTQGDTNNDKQDCETRAFRRLAARMKRDFPRLPIMVLLDGLYPNGPIMEICRKNKWQFMIVLQDKSLPSVWEEYNGLKQLEPNNCLQLVWGNRRQVFRWVNGIEYGYGPNQRKRQKLHVVVCEESWEEICQDTGEAETKTSRHAWVSSKPLNKSNLHERCNLGARHRWGIETGILVEKRHGYQYEHCFSHNWNAMRGYHALMRLGHLFNVLAHHSEALAKTVRELGARGFVRFVRETMAGPWLIAQEVRRRMEAPFQLRLE